jgi:repressor LexA
MAALTRRQRQVLDFVQAFTDENGYSPSLEEIAAGLGFSSVSNAHQHVTALVERGHLRRPRGKNRSLEVVRGDGLGEIPLLGTVAAGAPIETLESPEPFSATSDLLERGDFVVRWRGDALVSEQIADGDYLVVRAEPEMVPEALVFAVVAGRVEVGRVSRAAEGTLSLRTLAMPARVLEIDDAAVRGVLAGVVRLL